MFLYETFVFSQKTIHMRHIHFLLAEKIFFDFSWGLTYFLKLHIIIVQGGQQRVSAKALKHNSVPECLVMQSFQ